MDAKDLWALKPKLDRFLDTYAPLFGRGQNASHARVFVQGLLRGGERRNAENMAEGWTGPPFRILQAFLATGAWRDTAILGQMRHNLLAVLTDDDAVVNADETGFPKKGTESRWASSGSTQDPWAAPTTARSGCSSTAHRRTASPPMLAVPHNIMAPSRRNSKPDSQGGTESGTKSARRLAIERTR